MSNLKDHWLVRTHVVYSNFIVALFLLIAVLHLVLFLIIQVWSPFWHGLAIGLFATIAISELGMRYRLHRFGRV